PYLEDAARCRERGERAGGDRPRARSGPGLEERRRLTAEGSAAPLPERAAPVRDALDHGERGVLGRPRRNAQLALLQVEAPLPAALALEAHAERDVDLLGVVGERVGGEGPGHEAFEEFLRRRTRRR